MPLEPVTRQDPAGMRLEDGFSCKIAFENAPDIGMWEVEVQPIGDDVGEKINTTTMHNVEAQTAALQQLYESTDGALVVAYDPADRGRIRSLLIGKEQNITLRYPDGVEETFFGGLRSFVPQNLVKGTFPLADCVITPTNTDPASRAETPPAITSGGTGT